MQGGPNGFAKRLTVFASALAVALIVGAYVLAVLRVQALELPTYIRVSICGNGQVEDEVCDDGTINNVGTYSSSTADRVCNPDCQGYGPYCGDGVLQVRFSEACDDGNNTPGDLCSDTCTEEVPVKPRAIGSPPRGSVPPLPAIPGQIPSELLTKVVLRGKAYPNSVVNILLEGKKFGSVQADSNADFLFTTNDITPGTTVFSFNAIDRYGTGSITSTAVFDVVQSAVTTVANIFLPPTVAAKPEQVAPGSLVMLSGQSVPNSEIKAEINPEKISLVSDTDASGDWALQVDTKSLKQGAHLGKAAFTLTSTVKSGFGKSVSFYIGTPPSSACGKPDMNDDGKVNLVDFSIFLLSWNTAHAEADYNCDTRVNLADFSIMLFAWTG